MLSTHISLCVYRIYVMLSARISLCVYRIAVMLSPGILWGIHWNVVMLSAGILLSMSMCLLKFLLLPFIIFTSGHFIPNQC